MNSYELVAMQQQSFKGGKRLSKSAKSQITTYQCSIPIGTIIQMKQEEIIKVLHWEHATKEGFQRIENENHILSIAKYIIQPNVLTPQNIILAIRKDSFFNFIQQINEVGILEVNKNSIVTLLDGQHRIAAFIRVLDQIDKDINGLCQSMDNGTDYQIWKVFRENGYEANNIEKTVNNLMQLQKKLLNYKLSCNFITNLTLQQEIEIFLNLNTKSLHIDQGLADHLRIQLGQVDNIKAFAYKYVQYIQNNPYNIFHEFLKPVNVKNSKGTITEVSFARSISKTRLIPRFVDLCGNKEYDNPKVFTDFVKLMDEFWLALKDTMPDAFDIKQQEKYSFIRSAGMESFSGLLIRIVANQSGLKTCVPNFELNYAFFRSCFDLLKKHNMGFAKQDNWKKGGYSAKSFGSSANKSLGEEMWEVLKTAAFNNQLVIQSKYLKKRLLKIKNVV